MLIFPVIFLFFNCGHSIYLVILKSFEIVETGSVAHAKVLASQFFTHALEIFFF